MDSATSSSSAIIMELDIPALGESFEQKSSFNLDGRCFLCLKSDPSLEASSSSISNICKDTLRSFHSILCYLGGYPHSYHQGQEDDEDIQILRKLRMMGVPPLCEQCLTSIQELQRFHEELLDAQKRIQNQTVRIRSYVTSTIEVEDGGENIGSRRDLFLEEMKKNNIGIEHEQLELEESLDLVVKVHDRIISRGDAHVPYPTVSECQDASEECLDIHPVALLDVEFHDGILETPPLKKQKIQNEEQELEVPAFGEDSCVQLTNANDTNQEFEKTSDSPAPQQTEAPSAEVEIVSGGDATVNIGGVPVNPNANYVMITTNVTDPTTGVVSVQPILISVSQLQAMQQQPALPITTSTVPTPSTSEKPKKSSKNVRVPMPVGAYSTPSEYLYYNEDLQPCDVCNARIPRGFEVASHLATHVGSDYVFYCSDCELGFISPFRLEKYHRSKQVRCPQDKSPLTGFIFSCDQCSFQTQTLTAFKKHLDEHETLAEGGTPKPFQCPLCPLRFTGKKSVELHLGEKHVFTKPSGRQKCDICSSFFNFGEIEAHLWSHGVGEVLRCKMCMCMFSSLDAIIEHQIMGKRKRSGTHDISCHVCGSRFLRGKDLRLHYFEEHSLGTKYLCEKCNEDFFSLQTLQTHQQKCTQDDDIIPVVPSTSSSGKKKGEGSIEKKECPECGKLLSTPSTLLRHRIKEHGHPPIKCNRTDCQQTFNSEPERKYHVKTVHQGFTFIQKAHVCPECGESFGKKCRLKSHLFVKHSDAKPYTCELCGLAYRSKGGLQEHMTFKHLGGKKEKDKVCNDCGKAFSDAQVLKHHKLIHTKERPFGCGVCGQRFRQRTALRTHERSHAELGDAFKPKGEMERNKKKD